MQVMPWRYTLPWCEKLMKQKKWISPFSHTYTRPEKVSSSSLSIWYWCFECFVGLTQGETMEENIWMQGWGVWISGPHRFIIMDFSLSCLTPCYLLLCPPFPQFFFLLHWYLFHWKSTFMPPLPANKKTSFQEVSFHSKMYWNSRQLTLTTFFLFHV